MASDFGGAHPGVLHGVCGQLFDLEAEHRAQVCQTLKRPFSVAAKPVVVPDDDDEGPMPSAKSSRTYSSGVMRESSSVKG